MIKSAVGDGRTINAIGYNIADNYIYGALGTDASTNLIRISASGASVTFGSVGFTVSGGDVDENSQYWATDNGNKWIQIDLKPGSTTYGQTISTGTVSKLPDYAVYDWAYIPGIPNYLYAIGYDYGALGLVGLFANTYLMQFDRRTKTWKTLTNYGNIIPKILSGTTTWGAAYASDDKALYASENGSGIIWKFPLPESGSTTAKQVSNGPKASTNDGARCVNAKGL